MKKHEDKWDICEGECNDEQMAYWILSCIDHILNGICICDWKDWADLRHTDYVGCNTIPLSRGLHGNYRKSFKTCSSQKGFRLA